MPFFNHIRKKKLSSQSARENLVVFHNGCTYDIESKDYHTPIKTNSSFNSNYIKYVSNRDKDKNLSPKEYLAMIKPYLSDIINEHKKWKIWLTMQIKFISSKDLRKTCIMTKSDNIKIMMGSETNDIIEKLLESLQKYHERLEESITRTKFIFDSVDLLYYHLYRIILLKNEKAW